MAVATSYGAKGADTGISMVRAGGGAGPGVVYCHGRAANGIQLVDPSWALASARALARVGYKLLGVNLGGTTAWGNDTAQAALTAAKTHVQTTMGARSGPIGVVGASMGGLLALNWARANPSTVAWVALIDPVVDLAHEHDNNIGGLAAEIETAYGGAPGYSAGAAAHDPMQHTADYVGVPIKMWYSSDDTVAVTARQEAFVAATGCASVNLGAVGHSGSTVDGQSVARFAQQNLPV